jgi:hypothetical protein
MEQSVRYSITESCMQPSGAYAKTWAGYPEEDIARAAYQVTTFQGPAVGIIWSKTITLAKSWWEDGVYQREVLAQRDCT